MKLIFKFVALTMFLALVFASASSAPNHKPKPPKPPKPSCGVPHKPPCPQPPPAPQPPPPPQTEDCDHSVAGGKDGKPGNDDCAPDVVPPPPPPPAQIAPPPPPALVLNCPAGMTEIGRTSTQIMCSKTVTVTKTIKGKTIIKRAKPKTKVKLVRYCPRKPKDHGLAG